MTTIVQYVYVNCHLMALIYVPNIDVMLSVCVGGGGGGGGGGGEI